MRKRLAAAAATVALAVGLAACSGPAGSSTETAASQATAVADVSATLTAAQVLAGNKAVDTTDPTPGADVTDVALNGSSVTIDKAGTYRLHGTVGDGQVIVNAPDAAVTLILDGVGIASSSGAAIAATEVDRLVVYLADGTTNTLSDASGYAADADVNAALFSAGDLVIAGGGALTVHGRGNDAIAGKDGLRVVSGQLTVDAVDDGLRGKDYLAIEGGTLTVTAGGDGLKADNTTDADRGFVLVSGGTTTLSAGGDGVDATTDLVVTGGSVTVTAGGGSGRKPVDGESTKALKSGTITVLERGTLTLDSSDDAVHSDGAVHLNGAAVSLASGDDGVHAESELTIDGGTLDVRASYEGLESAHITVNAGDVRIVSSDDGLNAVAAGASGGGGGGGFGGGGGGETVADASLAITGGTVVVTAGGDGFDSNGTAAISGGTLVVNGPTANNNGALDVNGSFTVTGGVVLAAGSAGMAVAPDASSSQGWLSATLGSAVAAGTTLHVVGPDGTVIATFVTSKSVQNLVYSSSAIAGGQAYKIYSGGTASGTSTGGLHAAGQLGSAALVATVTAGTAPAGGMGGAPRR